AIKEKFVIACKSVLENREDFLADCQQVRDLLSDCTALERKVDELFVQQNEVNAILQVYIRENATKPQKQDEYNERYNEYAQKSDEIKKAIAAVQAKIARRLSRKELLDGMLVYIQDQYTHSPRQNPDSVRGMMRELETADLALTQFDEKLWCIMVENVTVGLDGEMVFRFRNGMEVTVE
ncbi:MAG: hypothetical protein IJ265_12395, partial [Oscillospiraceae bacterium]|nr:hypothetical protein [Oscillospiraceae bacterium]